MITSVTASLDEAETDSWRVTRGNPGVCGARDVGLVLQHRRDQEQDCDPWHPFQASWLLGVRCGLQHPRVSGVSLLPQHCHVHVGTTRGKSHPFLLLSFMPLCSQPPLDTLPSPFHTRQTWISLVMVYGLLTHLPRSTRKDPKQDLVSKVMATPHLCCASVLGQGLGLDHASPPPSSPHIPLCTEEISVHISYPKECIFPSISSLNI